MALCQLIVCMGMFWSILIHFVCGWLDLLYFHARNTYTFSNWRKQIIYLQSKLAMKQEKHGNHENNKQHSFETNCFDTFLLFYGCAVKKKRIRLSFSASQSTIRDSRGIQFLCVNFPSVIELLSHSCAKIAIDLVRVFSESFQTLFTEIMLPARAKTHCKMENKMV